MKDPNIYQPSEVELEILQILWEKQPASVRTVHEQILQNREVSYTTVLTFLQRMTEKEMVRRHKQGKVHYYEAVPKEAEVQESLFKRLLNTAYKGSAMKMVMHALGQGKVDQAELEKLQEWLVQQKQKDE
ncbi:MAG: BlaI/MecI/CopY family transcriptional regulator [Saprospiraceae bacterium]|nr:BlaI/MecI/CopY family transcriptional regulator [Lewinella sp.]